MTEKWDLSRKDVRDSLPVDRNRLFADARQDGLYVRAQDGEKTWAARYSLGSVQRQKSLPLSQPYRAARDLARELRLEARRGRDIVAEQRAAAEAAHRQAEAAKAQSLRAIAELYLTDAPKRLQPASVRVARLYLRSHWRPLHDRPADDLGRREIVSVLERYAGRATSDAMLRHLSTCLSWGMERGLLEHNAALGIKPPVQLRARERVLSDAEKRVVWLATAPENVGEASEAYREFCAIVRLLMLLAQRRSEVGGMMWSELDLQRGLWRLPGDRTKNKRPHEVPLPRQALEILQARAVEGRTFVFGRRDHGFTAFADHKQALDAQLGLPRWTLHDARRTAVTSMAELGIAPHVIEAIVNHVSGHKAGVAGVYNRATYAVEKRAALQRWADHLDRIVAGEPVANVVEFGR